MSEIDPQGLSQIDATTWISNDINVRVTYGGRSASEADFMSYYSNGSADLDAVIDWIPVGLFKTCHEAAEAAGAAWDLKWA